MNLWDANLDPHRIELTSKDLCEGTNALCEGSKDLCEGSKDLCEGFKPCRSTPPHLVTTCPPFTAGLNPIDLRE